MVAEQQHAKKNVGTRLRAELLQQVSRPSKWGQNFAIGKAVHKSGIPSESVYNWSCIGEKGKCRV